MIRGVSTTGLRDVTFDEALAEVRAQALDLPAEPVALEDLMGRVLAEDVVARGDHPAFTNSAMDGYAVRAADAAGGGALRIVGESRAGAPYPGQVGAGEAVRISTGGELPEGADAILRVEDGTEEGEGHGAAVRATVPPEPGIFVRRRGEDVHAGQPLLLAGRVVGPHEVAAVAGAGHARVLCVRRARVAVVGSGDEVVPAGGELGPGQVYDANRPGVAAQAEAAGARVVARAVVPDDLRATIATIGGILDGRDAEAPDLLVTTGGVSVGRHDHLRPALEACGVAEVLYGVEIRPGHPLWLGRRGAQLVLGLPGNPVSAAVCFHVFGRPLLGRGDPWTRRMPMAERYVKPTPRTELIRCTEVDGALRPLPRQGSHAITSLAGATHLAAIEAERREVAAGEEVRAAPLV
jgi:molybdopterin molybdotransferase